jgi:hypothetical protein
MAASTRSASMLSVKSNGMISFSFVVDVTGGDLLSVCKVSHPF